MGVKALSDTSNRVAKYLDCRFGFAATLQYHAKKTTLPNGTVIFLIDRIEQPNLDFDPSSTNKMEVSTCQISFDFEALLKTEKQV